MVQRSGCELRYILLTHGHFDHCTGVAGMLERHPELPVYICEKDVTDGVAARCSLLACRRRTSAIIRTATR